MYETALSLLDEFRRNFRIADAVDILLMSIFFYSALIWFKETASRRILIGVLLLVIVYFCARIFDMYLTSLVFHTGFAALVIVLIVVFQEDLRRMFERVAGWGTLRRLRQTPQASDVVDLLVAACDEMAASRTGALIVLQGRDPLARHLSGGTELEGHLSSPLLLSIFDSSSPGHDGAVILHQDRIQRFAAHLPISQNRTELAGRGTRHAAALGLSERCDALVLVVSEERGTVSVAGDGKLTQVDSTAALRRRIDAFLAEKHPPANPATWSTYITAHGPLKALALCLATIAWFVLAYNPSTIQRTFVLPIQYRNLPPHLALTNEAPDEARVTLSGSERNFRFLTPESMRVSIDLSKAKAGAGFFPVTESSIGLPPNLNLYRVEPPYVYLVLKEASSAGAPASPEPVSPGG